MNRSVDIALPKLRIGRQLMLMNPHDYHLNLFAGKTMVHSLQPGDALLINHIRKHFADNSHSIYLDYIVMLMSDDSQILLDLKVGQDG